MAKATNITWHEGAVSRDERAALMGGNGATLWFTGLSGSGKSTVATAVEQRLVGTGRAAYRLDGDNLRSGINADLGFSKEERLENCRRVAEVARLFADAGMVAVVAIISPYAESRELARRIHAEAGLPFVEVFMATPAEECAMRDPKGLYAKASAGTLGSFTGIDDPYEVPEHPDVVVAPSMSVVDATDLVLASLSATEH
ncbi:MAG TPA: adenylyl-sulfate kinase [Acidimicrobiales bacterium]